jgi:2,5-diketo-D-gluconate reductase B
MKYLLARDAKMPALGFGTWQLNDERCYQAVATAIEIGYRHIDTAQAYENEAEVGRAIEASGVARAEIFLTTKLWMSNFGKARVAASLEESLDKLRTDHVDLLLMHWPNPDVPLEETLEAMRQLVQAGKVAHIGVSNFPVALLREAVEKCEAPIYCNQVEYHALLSQRPVLDYARQHDMIVTAYSPLARGRLAKHETLLAIGRKYEKTASQVALRWLIQQDGVAAIPKAASAQNARANFDIFDFNLSAEEMKMITELGGNQRFVNPGFAPVWDAA